MTGPLVSCIVPVYNGARYLRDALASVLNQTYQRHEIVVVDDGSTDDTPHIAAEYAQTVIYLRQGNAGPAAARNRGLQSATGKFVAFLDADDLWLPEKTERQLARFAARPELGYCVTHVQNFWEAELEVEARELQGHARSQPIAGYVTGTLLARRALFEIVGDFDAALGHGDAADWFLRADSRGAEKELLPEVLMRRRIHPANRSRVHAAGSRQEFLRLLKSRLDRRRKAAE